VPVAAPTRSGPALRTDVRSRFTLFNLLGQERAWYTVDRLNVARPAEPVAEKSVAHSVVIIDRSGSMTGSIEDLKETLIKLLTLEEYRNFDLLVTLISYSGQGDLNVHFQRSPIQEIMQRNSRQVQEIKKIRTTGLTCISQALTLAASLVQGNELTAVTLHSDGYANDPSATAESKSIEQMIERWHDKPVFVNTIAYTDYSDFRFLSKIANGLSGACVKAGSIREVYDTLYSTSKLLGGAVTPPLEEALSPEFDYQVFVSHSAGKINGAAGPLFIRGLGPEDDAHVYKFKKVTQQEYKKHKDLPEAQTSEAVFAFARAHLAEGNLNTAKYALASTFDRTLLDRHGRALTNLEVAALAVDLDNLLFQAGLINEHEVLDHVAVNRRISLLDLATLLARHTNDFTINFEHLQQNYARRGLKRVPGTRDADGKLVPPWLETRLVEPTNHVRVQSFDINHNTANLNILIPRRVQLIPAGGGAPITQVAGVPLDRLSIFNNYTLVGDGELNVRTLRVKISDRALFERLVAAGALEAVSGGPVGAYDSEVEYALRLDLLPLVPPFEAKPDLTGVFNDLAEMKVLSSLVASHLKEVSEVLTSEQVEELKRHYLSKNLYLNFPTTTEYTDLQEALAEGTVDTRTSYKIDTGSRNIINLSKLMSANKFLDRIYESTDAQGQKIDKPTGEDLLDPAVHVSFKKLSARTKITAVDEFMKRLFDNFLGLADTGAAVQVLQRVGATELAGMVAERCRGRKPNQAAYVRALTAAQSALDRYAEEVFEAKVSPLVFFVGSTGVLPDEIDARAMTAEQLQAKYPDLALSKDEQDGTFFEIGDTIISVYAKREYFSRGAGVSGGANVAPPQM
jgi:hypothetical protein